MCIWACVWWHQYSRNHLMGLKGLKWTFRYQYATCSSYKYTADYMWALCHPCSCDQASTQCDLKDKKHLCAHEICDPNYLQAKNKTNMLTCWAIAADWTSITIDLAQTGCTLRDKASYWHTILYCYLEVPLLTCCPVAAGLKVLSESSFSAAYAQ